MMGPREGKAQYPNGETEGVIIPQGVTSVGQLAFNYWPENNQPLVISDSVTSIVAGAFSYWPANNYPLVIPNSVTSIGNNAFSDWGANTHPLVIPNSVTSIGEFTFGYWALVPYVEMKELLHQHLVTTIHLMAKTTHQYMCQMQVLQHIKQRQIGYH